MDTVRTEQSLSVKLDIWDEVNEIKRGLEIWNWVRNNEIMSGDGACGFQAGARRGQIFKDLSKATVFI